jgi:galactokinase
VHGGGFAGTIQAFVKTEDVASLKSVMDACFGEGACMVLNIRPVGAARVF